MSECDIAEERQCIVGLSVKDGEGVSAAEGVRNVGKRLRGRLGGLEAKRIERRSGCKPQ